MAYGEPYKDAEGSLPALQRVVVVVPQARVATLFSNPFLLLPGTPGKANLIEKMHMHKPAGNAWTTTGSGTLRVVFGNPTTAIEFSMFDQGTTTAFFGATEDVWLALGGKGQFSSIGNTISSNHLYGADIYLRLLTADITNGTGDLTVTLWYRTWGLATP